MIDLNVTLLIQVINFVITLVLVNALLIRPIRDIMRRRKATREGLNTGIQELVARVAGELATYEDTLRVARKQATETVRSAREEALAGQAVAIGVAGSEAVEVLREGREHAQAAAGKARRDLESEIPKLADAVVNRLLA